MSENTTEKTPIELEKMRKNLTQYYKEQSVVLKAQKEYECLLADIEDARQRRILSTLRMAQMLNPEVPKEEPEPEPEPVKHEVPVPEGQS